MSTATNIPANELIAVSTPAAAEAAEFRRRIGTISRQSAVYFAGTILTGAAAYFFKIYLARALGAEALGLYALGMSVIGFLGIFNAIGLPTAAARFVAEYSALGDNARLGGFLKRGLGLLLVGNVLLGIAVLAVGPWLAARFYHAPALNRYFAFFALIMLLGVLNTFLEKCMAGYRNVARRTVITHFIGTPGNMVVAVILISLGLGLAGYLAAQVISALLVLSMLGISVWRLTPSAARAASSSAELDRNVVSFSAVALGIATVHFVLTQADKIILGVYLNPKQVGIYAVAMAMVGFVPIALQSVNQIFSPMIAELHASNNHELLGRLYVALTKWILIFTLPLAMTVIIFSQPLIGIFGRGFETGAAVLTIGAVGQIFNCAVGSVGFLLLMSGNQMKLVRIEAGNAVLMLALSIVLVPRFGITGAAIAAASTVAATNLWALAVVSRTLKLFPYDSSYLKLVPPVVLSAGALVAVHRIFIPLHSGWRVAAVALVCAYVTFVGSLLMLGLDGEDRRIAQIAWSKISIHLPRNGASTL